MGLCEFRASGFFFGEEGLKNPGEPLVLHVDIFASWRCTIHKGRIGRQLIEVGGSILHSPTESTAQSVLEPYCGCSHAANSSGRNHNSSGGFFTWHVQTQEHDENSRRKNKNGIGVKLFELENGHCSGASIEIEVCGDDDLVSHPSIQQLR